MARTAGSDRIWFAQMLRGVAVLLVLLEHMLVGLWINPVAATGTLHMTAPPDPAAMDQFQIPTALWLIRHDIILGNIGVAFFFLISGFVIPMSLERLSAGRFVVARIFRLYPVWIACMAITAAAFWIYALATSGSVPYSPQAWLTNLALVQDWVGDAYINPVVWTLVIELKFYALCFVLAALGGLHRAWPIVALVGALTIFTINANGMLADRIVAGDMITARAIGVVAQGTPFIAYMFIGVAFYNLFRGRWSVWQFGAVGAALTALFVTGVRGGIAPELWQGHVLVGFSIGGALFVAAYLLRAKIPYSRTLNVCADLSYPLYAIHYIAGGILMLTLYDLHPVPLLNVAETMIVVIALSWLVHRYVEVPFNNFGKRVSPAWLRERLRPSPAAPVAAVVTPEGESAAPAAETA